MRHTHSFIYLNLPKALRPNAGHGLLIHEVSRSHTTTQQSVRLLWTSDQLVAETSNWQQTSMPPVGFEPTISVGERPQTYALDRAATGTGFLHLLPTLFNLIDSQRRSKSTSNRLITNSKFRQPITAQQYKHLGADFWGAKRRRFTKTADTVWYDISRSAVHSQEQYFQCARHRTCVIVYSQSRVKGHCRSTSSSNNDITFWTHWWADTSLRASTGTASCAIQT